MVFVIKGIYYNIFSIFVCLKYFIKKNVVEVGCAVDGNIRVIHNPARDGFIWCQGEKVRRPEPFPSAFRGKGFVS